MEYIGQIFGQLLEILDLKRGQTIRFSSNDLLNFIRNERIQLISQNSHLNYNEDINKLQNIIPVPLLTNLSQEDYYILFKQILSNFLEILPKNSEPRIHRYICFILLYYMLKCHEVLRQNSIDDWSGKDETESRIESSSKKFSDSVENFWNQASQSLRFYFQNLSIRLSNNTMRHDIDLRRGEIRSEDKNDNNTQEQSSHGINLPNPSYISSSSTAPMVFVPKLQKVQVLSGNRIVQLGSNENNLVNDSIPSIGSVTSAPSVGSVSNVFSNMPISLIGVSHKKEKTNSLKISTQNLERKNIEGKKSESSPQGLNTDLDTFFIDDSSILLHSPLSIENQLFTEIRDEFKYEDLVSGAFDDFMDTFQESSEEEMIDGIFNIEKNSNEMDFMCDIEY